MARSIDDDATSRLSAAEQQIRAKEQTDLADLRRQVRKWERDLARRRSLARARWIAVLVALGAFLAGLCWTVLNWGSPARLVKVDIVCGALAVLAAVAITVVGMRLRLILSRADLEDGLDTNREALRFFNAVAHPSLAERRSFYREDVAGVIEHYQAESRKYRNIHNSLQSLIMIGSTATTTVAALDSGYPARWHSFTLTGISFAITLAAMFTGYYKYRERSYFLQQTADAIEEEANAVALGVGAYQEFGPDRGDQALAKFTQRVEDLRNEQRRRQQQLDQPAEQTGASGQSQS